MKVPFQILLILASWLLPLCSAAQKHKIMIVPFEPRLYMSQVDHKFNAETKQTQKQIRETFRRGVNKELESALKKNYEVLDLMKDTAKYRKELHGIYRSLTYSFDKVPDQSNYKAPVTEKNKSESIKNGQLVVETDPEARFMNAKVTSAALIPALFAKYKTDLYLFVNQLDIVSATLAAGETGTLSERSITVHYTLYTVDAKEIQSGTCTVKFPGDVNSPSKVISSFAGKIAQEITRRIAIAVAKKDALDEKKK
jgi:hypothetical protein